MGLIKAGAGAVGSVFGDQWKEYFYCDALEQDVLVRKGSKRTGKKSSNKGSDNIISNGSVIAVADGQCMLIVDQGRVVELCATPGEFVYDSSSEPSIFAGSLGQSIKDSFSTMAKRFTFGGDTAKDQRVYYVNTKEMGEVLYGTATPIPFRVVVNEELGFKLSVKLRCNGNFTYRVADPILFYTNVCGNVAEDFESETIEGKLKGELMTALQPALAKLSADRVMYYEIPAHTMDVAAALNDELSDIWRAKRGLEVVSFNINSLSIPEDQEKKITEWEENAMTMNQTVAASRLVGESRGLFMKKLSILCSSLLLALMMCFPVFASEDLRYVEDNADLLTVSEQQELNDTLTEISERQGVDVAVITANDMGDKSIEDYAKAKYEERGYGDDGVLLVVNMEVRKWWMSTYGKGTTAISSEGISTIGSEFAPYLSNGEYASAFDTYARLCDDYITRAPNLSEEYAQALSGLTSLQDGLRFVNDDARLLTEDERKELNDTLTQIGKRQGLDVAILTTKDTGGKALLDYAMTMYEALEYGQGKNKDGILLVVNMETRKFWMATHGYGITAFTDAGISYISEKLGPSLKKEKYMKAFTTFGSLCEKFVEKAHNGKPYDVGNMPFKWLPWYCVPISLLVGFVCAVFVVSKKREQLHSVSFEDKAHNYMKKNTLKMKESHDYFLYHTITRNRIKSDDDDSSSGGSSTFTSSSGDTYGGGGGSF